MTTNDPRQPLVTFTLMGTARPGVHPVGQPNSFGSVPQGKEVSREIVITVVSSRPLKLLSVVSTDGNVRVRFEPIPNSGGKSFRLITVRKPDGKPGGHFGTIVVRTSSTYRPELEYLSAESSPRAIDDLRLTIDDCKGIGDRLLPGSRQPIFSCLIF